MKKTLCIILALCMALTASGCGSMFAADYYHSEPYKESATVSDGTETEVRNASTLKKAILELIYAGESQGQFRFGRYTGSLMDDIAAVCLEIKTSTPVGAYAVEDISYDTSRIVSYYTADISITYKKTPEEIAAVEELSGLAELENHLLEKLASCADNTVIKIYSAAASEEYIRSFVEESYYSDPLLVAMKPLVGVAAYPENGPERIYVISFRYGTGAEQLLGMKNRLGERVSELTEDLKGEDMLSAALRSAARLAELSGEQESVGAWPETAYGALIEGGAEPFGIAMAYKALCDSLSIPCTVVRGEYRGAESGAHAWNIIELDGDCYHVDVSRFYADALAAFLLSDEDIWGEYDWDTERYPTCDGQLGPEDVFELPPAVQEDTPPADPSEGEAPETTPTPDGEGSPDEGEAVQPETAPDGPSE